MTVPALPQEAFEEMDRRDEAQMMAELEGQYLEEYVYEFQQGGQKVVGISWIGVKAAINTIGTITIPPERVEIKTITEDDQNYVMAVVHAVNLQTQVSIPGVAVQPKHFKDRFDPFCYQKALSKATRNAFRHHLPETVIRAWIEHHWQKPMDRKKPAVTPQALTPAVVQAHKAEVDKLAEWPPAESPAMATPDFQASPLEDVPVQDTHWAGYYDWLKTAGTLKDRMINAFGETEGIRLYYGTLGHHGCKHRTDARSHAHAGQIYRDLLSHFPTVEEPAPEPA